MKLNLLLIGLLLVTTSLSVSFAQDAGEAAAQAAAQEAASDATHDDGEHEEHGEDDGEYDEEGMDDELDKEEEIRLHKEEFDVMDTNHNGKLELDELQAAAKEEDIEDSEIKEFVEELDTDKDNAVSWDEYMDGLFSQEFEEGYPEEYEDEEAFLNGEEHGEEEHDEEEHGEEGSPEETQA